MSRYCACGVNGIYALSDDLTNWAVAQAPSGLPLYDVARGSDRYVIVGDRTEVVIVDGQAPAVYEHVGATSYPFKICFARGYFWRVRNESNPIYDTIQKSTDGITWEDVTVPLSVHSSISIAGNDSVIIVTGASGYAPGGIRGTMAISSDGGATWTGLVSRNSNAVWVAGVNGARAYHGAATDWISYYDPPYAAPVYSAGNALQCPSANAVGMAFSTTHGICPGSASALNLTEDGGATWTPGLSTPFAATIRKGIVFDGNRFVGVGSDAGEIVTISSNGSAITQVGQITYGTPPVPVSLYGIASGGPYDSLNIYVPHDGAWKRPTSIHVPHAGAWKQASQIFVPVNGEWKSL